MSEQRTGPTENELAQSAETQEKKDITQRPEYAIALQNIKRGGDLVRELFRLGVPESELRPFALARLEKYIRDDYGLGAIHSMAKRSGLITEEEVGTLFAKTKADIMFQNIREARVLPEQSEEGEERQKRETKAQFGARIMAATPLTNETEKEKADREAAWLADMLAQYDK